MGTSGFKPVGTPAEQAAWLAKLQTQLLGFDLTKPTDLREAICVKCLQPCGENRHYEKINGAYIAVHVKCPAK